MRFLRVTSLLFFSAIITAFLSVPITTASYTIWLSSIEMPVTLNLFIASLIHDWFNLGVMLFLLFLAGFLIAFLISTMDKLSKSKISGFAFKANLI